MLSIILAVAATVVTASGFGSYEVLIVSLAIGLGSSLTRAASKKIFSFDVVLSLTIIAVLVIDPAASQIRGIQVLFLSLVCGSIHENLRWPAVVGGLILWLLPYTPWACWLVAPGIAICVFWIASLVGYFFHIDERWCKLLIATFAVLIIVVELFTAYLAPQKRNVQIYASPTSNPGYSIGKVFTRLVGAKDGPPLNLVSLYQNSVIPKSCDIVLSEHGIGDPGRGWPLISADFHQGEPWGNNQLVGDQYLLYALRHDGFFASNLGGQIRKKGRLLLGQISFRYPFILNPFSVKYDSTIFISDSDPLVDRLAVYQRNYLLELGAPSGWPQYLNLLCGILIAASLLPNKRGFLTVCCFSVILIGAVSALAFNPQRGEVRIIGGPGWPHEQGRHPGFLRSLADAGYLLLPGQKDCKILVCGEGRSADWKGETLVYLEPGAAVHIGSRSIKADDVPLGDRDGVIDARALLIDGKAAGPIVDSDGVRIIATGSPARQEHKRWLPESLLSH